MAARLRHRSHLRHFLVLLVRRNVPESPRWLFIHGRDQEADRVVASIEDEIQRDTGRPLPEPQGPQLKVRQRETISFREIAAVAFKLYPRRAILGLALFIGQAFLYNGVTFESRHAVERVLRSLIRKGATVLYILWALSNFVGPLLLGHLFDTVGRKPMITLSYVGSAVVALVLAGLFVTQTGGVWTFIIVLAVTFFLCLRRRQRRLFDRQRDLPDGDQGVGDRVLLTPSARRSAVSAGRCCSVS